MKLFNSFSKRFKKVPIEKDEPCITRTSFFVIWDSEKDYETNITRHSCEEDVINYCNLQINKYDKMPKCIIDGIPLNTSEFNKLKDV